VLQLVQDKSVSRCWRVLTMSYAPERFRKFIFKVHYVKLWKYRSKSILEKKYWICKKVTREEWVIAKCIRIFHSIFNFAYENQILGAWAVLQKSYEYQVKKRLFRTGD
jgi:hypothetical protein